MHLQELFTIHYFEHFRDYPFCGKVMIFGS